MLLLLKLELMVRLYKPWGRWCTAAVYRNLQSLGISDAPSELVGYRESPGRWIVQTGKAGLLGPEERSAQTISSGPSGLNICGSDSRDLTNLKGIWFEGAVLAVSAMGARTVLDDTSQ